MYANISVIIKVLLKHPILYPIKSTSVFTDIMSSIITSRPDYSDLDIDELVDKLTPGMFDPRIKLAKDDLKYA